MSQRLFIALALPAVAQALLDGVRTEVAGARWLRPEQRHLTLAFIGELAAARRAPLEAALEEVRLPAFEVRLEGGGRFPPRGRPRILWVGVAPEEPLRALAGAIAAALDRAGVPRDRKRFTPHVTVARVRPRKGAALGGFLETSRALRGAPFAVRSFQLYHSELQPRGARYTEERRFELV